MSHPFFRETLAFFRQAGRRLAEVNPRNADMLGRRAYDPDVERLIEGIAFLTGKIYERQARTLDEVCQLICDVLFPHYLSPLPGATIVQFDPPGADPLTLPRGSEVCSVPVLGTACRFRTAHAVQLDDLEIQQAGFGPGGSGSQLLVTFAGPDWRAREPAEDRLRLHLHGEPLITRQLYRWLLTELDGVDLINEQQQLVGSAAVRVTPAGLADDEALLSYPLGSFAGFRLLQEYFVLPDKFMFVDLHGVWRAVRQMAASVGVFGLRFRFRVPPPPSFVLSAENIRLRCAPAVNLFEHTADPIKRDARRVDFRMRPAGPHLHYEICRVLEVTGYSSRRATPYPPLSEVDPMAGGAFCQVIRRAIDGEVHSYLSPNDGAPEVPARQTLVIDLLCSNGKLTTALGVGDLRACAEPYPWLGCENITAVTRPAAPPLGGRLHRFLVMLLSLSQRDLTSLAAIGEALELHAFHAMHERQRARALQQLVGALNSSRSETRQRRHGRTPIWGRATMVELDQAAFDVEGESYLFGTVLNEYVARQTALNFYSELTLHDIRSGREQRWPTRLGRLEL